MKVLLTGATGLLGGALLGFLLDGGHEVRCLLREDSPNRARLDPERVEVFHADASDEGSIFRALEGVDAFVHVAGIEYAPRVVAAARRAGVGRVIAVSSTSALSAYPSRSGPKLEMEAVVRDSGLEWTVIRPAMIYGSERDRNMHRLLRFLDRSPVFPMFGPGTNLWQPVHHEDCARGLLAALETPASIRQTYELSGARPLAYLDLVYTAAAALGKRRRVVHVPIEPVRRVLRLAESARLPLPVSSEQVMRLREDKAYPYEKAARELGYTPRQFEKGIALEVARLREVGLLH